MRRLFQGIKRKVERTPGEIKLTYRTFFIMLMPILLVLIILELFVPEAMVRTEISSYSISTASFSINGYLLYLISAGAHFLISGTIFTLLFMRLLNNVSNEKRKVLLRHFLILLTLMFTLMVIVDSMELNLALLSHDRTYSTLLKSGHWKDTFSTFIGSKSSNYGFYTFTIMPVGLIVMGLACIVVTCLNVGKDLTKFMNKIKPDHGETNKVVLNEHLKSFQHYIHTLSFVLVTSTIATVLFIQLPATCINDDVLLSKFLSTSYDIGICWGVIFSLTMLFMCYYPHFRIQKEIKNLLLEAKVSENTELYSWLNNTNNKHLLYNDLKSVMSIFAPALVSMVLSFL